jgi:hypothetical protein
MRGNAAESFQKLPAYIVQLHAVLPGTTAVLEMTEGPLLGPHAAYQRHVPVAHVYAVPQSPKRD